MEKAQEDALSRYLVARRAIGAGELILEERALVCGPSQAEHFLCLECLKEVSSSSSSLPPLPDPPGLVPAASSSSSGG